MSSDRTPFASRPALTPKQFHGRSTLGLGTPRDKRQYPFDLGGIDPTVQESPPGELAGPGSSRPRLDEPCRHRIGQHLRSRYVELDQMFGGIGSGRTHDEHARSNAAGRKGGQGHFNEGASR